MTDQDSQPAAPDDAAPEAAGGEQNVRRWGRRFPGPVVLIVVAVCLGFIALMRSAPAVGNLFPDQASVNVATMVLAAITAIALYVWFVRFSAYSGAVRLLGAATPLLMIALFFANYKFVGVSGDLWLQFAPRWSAPPDRPTGEAAGVDLQTTTPHDFPQFLGPERNLKVTGVELARNWQEPPRQVWRQPIGAGWSGFAVVNGHAVTLEQRDREEWVTCYDLFSGNMEWRHAIDSHHSTLLGGEGPRSTPTIHEGKVYALGATGVLRCLDGAGGDLLWQRDLLEEVGSDREQDLEVVAWGRAASPLIVNRLVVVPAGGPPGGPFTSLMAFDAESGEIEWRGGDSQVSYSSPVVGTLAGRRQIVSVNEALVTGHDIATGDVLWSYDWPAASTNASNTSQPVLLGDDRVLVSKGYGQGAAVFEVSPIENGQQPTEPLWKNPRVLKTKFTNVAVFDGYAYALSDGILECVDVETGDRQWKRGRYGHGQILAVGDLLLVTTEQGEVVLVDPNPQELTELAKFQALDGKTWNTPALYGPYLLVRNAKEAACYELPLAKK